MGVVSSTAGQALWVLLAPHWDRHWGGVSSTVGQALWVLLAPQ